MLYIKAFHVIAMVTWFAGLFYLPRLFVYHAQTTDSISIERFKIMERRLYYGITWPGGLTTLVLGIWLLTYNWTYYMHAGWMHAKLAFVLLLCLYHLASGHFVRCFLQDKNCKSALFFRVFNEIPTVMLIAIVILVIVKPDLHGIF